MDLPPGRIDADGEERRALRRAQPLVGVPDVPVGADRVHVEVHVAGGMRPVDEYRDAARAAPAHDVGDREDQGGGRGDMVDDDQPGTLVERSLDRVRHVGGGVKRHRRRRLDDGRAAPFGSEAQGVADRAVHVVGGDDPLPGPEAERAQDRVDAARRVLEEDRALGRRSHEPGERAGGFPDEAGQLVHEEPRGLGLHAAPPLVLPLEQRARRRAVGPVVEEHHVLFERPEMPQGAAVPVHAAPPAGGSAASGRRRAAPAPLARPRAFGFKRAGPPRREPGEACRSR